MNKFLKSMLLVTLPPKVYRKTEENIREKQDPHSNHIIWFWTKWSSFHLIPYNSEIHLETHEESTRRTVVVY